MTNLKQQIIEIINREINIEDPYTYQLARVKEEEIEVDDFEEWDESLVESLAIRIAEGLQQPQLKDNQVIALDLLKEQGVGYPIVTIYELVRILMLDPYKYDPFESLSQKEEAEVLKTYAEWVLQQEATE